MSAIKQLKKNLKELAVSLQDKCVTYGYFHPECSPELLDQISLKIQEKLDELIYDVNHLKNAGDSKPKKYFNDILKRVNSELIPLLDEIKNIGK